MRLDHYHGTIDGLYGPRTEKAIISFAMSKELDVKNPEEVQRIIRQQEQARDASKHLDEAL